MFEVTGGRKLENGFEIPGTFKAITRSRRLGARFHEELYEREALMHSHGYFPQGNEKKTSATLRTLKNVCTVMSYSLKEPYTFIARHSVP